MTDPDLGGPAPTPFHDLDAYVDLPRGSGLVLSPDGSRLVTSLQTLDPKKTRYVTALWEVDATGERPARRLTRGAKGEGGAAFLPDGSLLFTFAPSSAPLEVMHKVGKLFPRGDRAPAIEPVREATLRKLIAHSLGRCERVSSGFYTSQALELVRA